MTEDLYAVARRVFDSEAGAIAALSQRLDAEFGLAVDALWRCRGRVVVSGLGKSGLIGKKIAATLSSTGTPSYFLHPADALHGDMGLLHGEDCFLSLSHSGETDELLQMVPYLRRLGLVHIALVGNAESSLARHADMVLSTGVVSEASDLAAVPMASSAAALAMGDALAACLMRLRDFRQEDFARIHPGGSLGRSLLTTVGERMRSRDLPTVQAHTPIQEVIVRISSGMMGAAAVCAEAVERSRLLGIITDGDLRRALQRCPHAAFFDLKASDLMTPNPKTIDPQAALLQAEQLLQQFKITVLPVVDAQGLLLGMIAKWQMS